MAALPATHPVRTGASAPGRTLFAASAATALILADFALPVPILPTLAVALRASVAEQTWVLSGASLAVVATLLTIGSLADAYGRRRVFRAGLVLLAASAVMAALAPDAAVFVAARAVQGVATAALLTGSLGLLAHAFPTGEARTHATGVWAAMMAAGTAVGPVFGALVAGWQWRAAYWLIAAAAVALLSVRGVTESRPTGTDGHRGVDWIGMLTLAGGVGLVVSALVLGDRHGWTSATVLGSAGAGGVLLAGFVLAESRLTHPMITLRLFRSAPFVGTLLLNATVGASVIAMMVYLPVYLQRGLRMSALGTSLVLLAWSVTTGVASMYSRRLARVLSTRALLSAGSAVCAVGEAMLRWSGRGSGWVWLLGGMLVVGAGNGALNAALARASVDTVPPERAGTGAGAANSVRYLGNAIGVAILFAAAQARIRGSVAGLLDAVPGLGGGRVEHGRLTTMLADGDLPAADARTPASAHPALADVVARAQTPGFGVVVLVVVGIALLGALAALLLLPGAPTGAGARPQPARPTGPAGPVGPVGPVGPGERPGRGRQTGQGGPGRAGTGSDRPAATQAATCQAAVSPPARCR